jgi:type I restriction enzyme S subunit
MTQATRKLLEQHFDIAFAAPDGIVKLRELILTLAMQGKLVEQDPNDPSASDLLKEIKAEKQRLLKEGKIKKPKALPPIKPEEVPYELPQGWEWVRLGELVSKLGSGSTPRGGKSAYVNEGIPFLRSQNVWNDGLRLEDVAYIPEETHQKMEATKVAAKDILLNITGASLGRTSLVSDEFKEANVSQHVTIIRCIQLDQRKFIHFLLQSPYCQSMIWTRQVGMAREGLSKKVLEQFEVPMPPLSEQHRIVARIDQLMACCDALETLRKQQEDKRLAVHAAGIKQLLDTPDGSAWDFIGQHFGELYTVKENVAELRKAILQLAVMGRLVPQDPNDPPASELLKEIKAEKQRLLKAGKIKKNKALQPIKPADFPYELPQRWEWVRFGELLVFGPKNGYSPRAVNYETPVRSLTLSATTSGTFKGEHSKYIDEHIEGDSNLWLQDGDILVQRGNTIEYVGVSAVYHGENNAYI